MISVTYIGDSLISESMESPAMFPLFIFQDNYTRTVGMNLCECGCGEKCNNRFVSGHNNRKHGYAFASSRHPLHRIWSKMKQRCYNQNEKAYKNYGGRGITVCKEWYKNADIFIDWCLSNSWNKELELDRIDNDGNYEPSNVRFVTHRKNNLNKRLLRSDNTSGYQGVQWDNKRNKWYGTITVKGKYHFLGYYTTKEQALAARNTFIIQNNLQNDYAIQNIRRNS